MILPESTSPGSNPAPAGGFSSVVPPAMQARVSIGPAPAWVRAQEVDETYRPASGQSFAYLLFDDQYHAGLRENYTRTVQRLETLSAVRAASQWRCEFDPATEEVVIHSLAVRRDGITVEHAQPECLRFLQREEQLEQYVMHGRVTVLVLLEDVRPGDILDLSLTTRRQPRLLRDRFWFLAAAPSFVPMRMCRFTVRFPSERPFAWKAYAPEFAPVIEETNGETTWLWTMENTEALGPETQVPGWVLPPRWLQVSDCASWREVIAGVSAAWQEALHDPELTRKAEEIALAAETLAQRVEKAIEFVQDEIRYLSVNIDLGGQIPSPPGEVLRRRYGDCKDKSFLLSQLLRRLGVPARPVLVNALWKHSVQEFLPTPDVFNHVVIEYELAGRRFWADATLTLQGGGALQRPTPDLRMGLPLSPDAQGLEPAPVSTAESSYELHETFYLDTTGRPSQLVVQLIARGSDAEELRRMFVSEGMEAVEKSREQFYQQFYDVHRLQPLEWQDDRARNVLVAGMALELPNAVALDDQVTGAHFTFRTHLITAIFGYPATAGRRDPLALPYPCHVEQRVTVVCKGVPPQESIPAHERRTAFEVRYHPLKGANQWGLSMRVQMLRDFLPARVFGKHKEWLSGIAFTLGGTLRLLMHAASLWRPGLVRSLLPTIPKAPAKAAPDAPLESRALPAEPAATLASLEAVAQPAPAAVPPLKTKAVPVGVSIGGSRRSRRHHFPNRAAIAGASFVVLVIIRIVLRILIPH